MSATKTEALPGYSMDISLIGCTDAALLAAMQRALSQKHVVIAEVLAAEFLRRVEEESDHA